MTEPQPPRWYPLDVREGDTSEADYDAPLEGVPDHMRPGLEHWIEGVIRDRANYVPTIERLLRLRFSTESLERFIASLNEVPPETLLRMTDALLHQMDLTAKAFGESTSGSWLRRNVGSLARILGESGSAWQVVIQPMWALQRRVAPQMQSTADQAFSVGDDAARELRAAWFNCFRRDPNYNETYRHVVLAVEAVAAPMFIPNSPTPTLGTAISHLRDTTSRYTVADLDDRGSESAVALLSMMETLWHNQPRHAEQGGATPDPVTIDEAEAVLYLAVTIVQLFNRGLVRRRDTN